MGYTKYLIYLYYYYTYRLMHFSLYTYLNVCIHIAHIHQNHMMLTLGPMASHDQKSNVAPHLIVLTLGMQWCHLCHWLHVTLKLAPMVSQNQKSHVAPHFNHLDPRNAKVPLMKSSTSHDCIASTKCIT